jgi:AAA+ ATPase superfamily predicted ATPase
MRWGFYGRRTELDQLADVFGRERWFFARITGRRRIGKTTLVREALDRFKRTERVFYVQIPDSAPAGVVAEVRSALDTLDIPTEHYGTRPTSLLDVADLVERLARQGYFVALDEFQYFNRKHLAEFTSHLRARVDRLSADADRVPGGLIVLGSLHAEIVALLDDRSAPLYNRTTHTIEVEHLDIESLLALLDAHAARDPARLLFLWNLFEGVPKFYRDAYEQGVLAADRKALLEAMFFRSSAPLRTEADGWFLSELRGRYDVVLKYVAAHPGCANGDIRAHVRHVSDGREEQVGGYLKPLIDKYGMVEKRLPVFAKPNARAGRYYIRDNFLRAWLYALKSPVAAVSFRPMPALIDKADAALAVAEDHALERLVGQLYEERSRKGLAGFALSQRIAGYWDSRNTEVDLVAVNEDDRIIRFGSCKRDPGRLPGDIPTLKRHAARFLTSGRHRRYADWTIEYAAIAPQLSPEVRVALSEQGVLPQDLDDLTAGM